MSEHAPLDYEITIGTRKIETYMPTYYDPRDIAHLPDHYPKLRYRALGPFASSVMLLASKVPLYTEAEQETEWLKKLGEGITMHGEP